MEPKPVIIVEGIMALVNRKLRDMMDLKIYVDCDSDVRLIRRIVRDYRYRGYSALETIARLSSVQRGEDRWISPFQEEADVMFNSALLFELAVIKDHIEPILRKVPNSSPEYSEAHRLLHFLSYIVSINDTELPPTSLLREFLGGSSFEY